MRAVVVIRWCRAKHENEDMARQDEAYVPERTLGQAGESTDPCSVKPNSQSAGLRSRQTLFAEFARHGSLGGACCALWCRPHLAPDVILLSQAFQEGGIHPAHAKACTFHAIFA